jgi:Skp family chaperone for outer membrane proteins
MSRYLYAGLVAALIATPALAQSSPGAAAPLDGPLIQGICLLSQQAVFSNAKIGAAATARLQQLAQQAQAGLTEERQSIEAQAKALEAEQGKLSPADVRRRQQTLSGRVQSLQAEAQQRSHQVEATREKALAAISQDAQPAIAEAYAAHHCGLLLDRNAVLGGNLGGDLTADVVRGLDARVTTITFDLEPAAAAPAQ